MAEQKTDEVTLHLSIPERTSQKENILRKALVQLSAETRVACPGIIQSFDSVKQTVVVQLAVREDIIQNGKVVRGITLPLIKDVPIFMPRAGNFVLTMPIKAGDECLVVFGDMCIDAWWESGGVQNQIDKRRHDLSDGFALVGVWSQPNVVSSYSTDSAQLRTLDGTVSVEIKDNEINITAPTVNVTGASLVNIEAGSNTTIEGKVFLNHIHSGVEQGAGNTGGVV